MNTYLFLVAERIPGQQEMQRFAHPIHFGVVNAPDFADAYHQVLENLRPTFADSPQPLEIRFEQMSPPHAPHDGPRVSGASTPAKSAAASGGDADGLLHQGFWRRHKPVDMDITFTGDD